MRVQESFSVYPVRAVIVMGVSGCGKTTIGQDLAARLNNAPFIDADTLHPPSNVAKMADGIPLGDADRWPWLHSVRQEIADQANLLLAAKKSREEEGSRRIVVESSAKSPDE
ncbi:hypothetical protein IWW38_004640, partial [Coemansia aciculifera]